ncbi:hypothetical protein EZV62_013595 [Acer yangbiense]|uniref:Aspartate aminotransferase n=1 Tax=Acer yangbiense TaxID=1000413 RepID=A0A5C7I1D3_9ROSI|nr:hypothetical protein EZV62_013595 [Acer yangbiense]
MQSWGLGRPGLGCNKRNLYIGVDSNAASHFRAHRRQFLLFQMASTMLSLASASASASSLSMHDTLKVMTKFVFFEQGKVKLGSNSLSTGFVKTKSFGRVSMSVAVNVSRFEENLMLQRGENKEYLPIEGLAAFNKATAELLFGADNPLLKEQRVETVQGNHKSIFNDVRVPWSEYRYYDPKTVGLDFEGMIADIKDAPEGSFILLHGCAHNPTGIDPTPDQWEKIADVIQEKNHIPFFDVAYQGFASGSLDTDAASVRLFAACGMELFVAQSYSKNLGLYAERIGAMNVVCSSADAAIVANVVGDPILFNEWKAEMEMMAGRIKNVRQKLFDSLSAKDKSGKDWSFILKQIGMFLFTGLNKAQSENMTNKWHVYLTKDGRISLAGLSLAKCEYLADAIIDSFHNMASTMLSLASASASASSLSMHDTLKVMTKFVFFEQGKVKLGSNSLSTGFAKTKSFGRVSMSVAVNVSRFEGITMAPPDPILGVSEAFRADTNDMKLNLGVGAYRTEELQPYVLDVVKKAENLMLQRGENKEYLPIEGLAAFNKATAELLFGADNPLLKEQRVATVQGLSGTGSLRLAAALIERYFPGAKVLISSPTWGNHKNIFNDARVPWSEYRYYDPKTVGLDFEGMIADIKDAPEGSFILLHGCAHNPTGIDPTPDQWEKIADVIQEKNHIPFFDVAYQGFASGSLDTDAASVRLFAARGMELFVAQSYSKNLGLYAERIGAMNVVCSSADAAVRVKSQLKRLARPMYSNPPIHGAKIVANVVGDPTLFNEWKAEMEMMAGRIKNVRQKLFDSLSAKDKSGKDWSFILKQIGMFSFTGLNKAQSENMTNKWHVYLTKDGRISLAGLSLAKCEYLADAIIDSFHNVS